MFSSLEIVSSQILWFFFQKIEFFEFWLDIFDISNLSMTSGKFLFSIMKTLIQAIMLLEMLSI